MKETFIVRTEWAAAILELEPADQATIFQNLFHFHSGNENLINLNNLPVKLIWRLIEPSLIRTAEKYDKRCETSSSNGKKGGRPKKEAFENLNNLNKPNEEPNENPKPIESLSDSVHDHDSDLNTHSHSKKREAVFPENSSPDSPEAERPQSPFCAAPPFPGNPKPIDVPPLPVEIRQSILERQFQTGKGIVTQEQVLEYWESWLPLNIFGEKFYPNVHEVYRHFANRCEQVRIANPEPPKPRAGGAYQNGSAASTARKRGGTIEDLQKLKRRSAAPGTQQPDFTETEEFD